MCVCVKEKREILDDLSQILHTHFNSHSLSLVAAESLEEDGGVTFSVGLGC